MYDGPLRRQLNQRIEQRPDGTKEYWRDVPRYIGLYRVSDRGRVKSLTRRVFYSDGRRSRVVAGAILIQFTDPHYGRTHVNLQKRNTGKAKRVGRIVLEAFVGPCPAGMECCHFPDRSPANNNISNLRWDTRAGNVRDAIEHGTFRFLQNGKGEQSAAAKFKNSDIPTIHRLYASGKSAAKIAARYGVTSSCIKNILRGRAYKDAQPDKPAEIRKVGKLTNADRIEIKRTCKSGVPYKQVAKRFGLNLSTVYSIANSYRR